MHNTFSNMYVFVSLNVYTYRLKPLPKTETEKTISCGTGSSFQCRSTYNDSQCIPFLHRT